MQRPTGITILSLVHFLTGGISLVMSCFALAVSDRLRAEDEDSDDVSAVLELDLAFRGNPVFWIGRIVFWIGVIGAGVSLFKRIAAAGLWTLKPSGRRLALVSGMFNLVTHVVGVTRGAITPSGVVGLLVNGAVLLCLSRPAVQRALAGVPIDAPATTP